VSSREARKIVLYLPRRADPARGEPYSADLLPLELLQIAGGPDADGYEVVLVDAAIEAEPRGRVLAACEGALLFAGSCILGYQVRDGVEVTRAVRRRFPELPIVWGGWFPSVVPEMYLAENLADAVAIGQGELTFREVVQAVDAGEPLDGVAGLALWRDGELVRTPPRPVVGFDELPAVPWHLFDFEPYRELQLATSARKVRHRMPLPRTWNGDRPPLSFSLFTSYGCPTDCSFCCSPLITGRRWKAMPGAELAAEVAELQERFGFEAVRFNDASWGVSERRTREFCEGLERGGTRVWWNATMEIASVLRYPDETLDAMAATGCHLLWLGAETGTSEMQERIGKNVPLDGIPLALERLVERDIQTGCFWIVGYPGETRPSMEITLREAARLKLRFRGCASEVYPFRAVPGTRDFERARELGWKLPSTFEEWSRCFEWKWNTQANPLPPEIDVAWRRYARTAAHFDQHVSEGPRWARRAMTRIAGWRLRRGNYALPVEQKLFDLLVKRSSPRATAQK